MANWIKGAIKRPGALHRALGVKQGEDIPESKKNAKLSSLHAKMEDRKLTPSESRLLKQLNLAKTLSGMRK